MPDITQQDALRPVERRLDGRSQGGGSGGKPGASEQPAKKVVAQYEEVAKAKPADDRITILGIPVEQITPATRAALAGLVAEINFLRGVVRRHEKSAAAKAEVPAAGPLEPEMFIKALGGALGQPAPTGTGWALVLVHVPTYEDIRRSSGLLAANSVLADVAQRLGQFKGQPPDGTAGTVVEVAAAMTNTFVVLGYAGGSNVAALTALGAEEDPQGFARAVRTHLTQGGYTVAGIEMALVIKSAAAVVGTGESATLALGRVDHLLRSA